MLLLAFPWSSGLLAIVSWLVASALPFCCWLLVVRHVVLWRWLIPALLLGLLFAADQSQRQLTARLPLCADEVFREIQFEVDEQPTVSSAAADQQVSASFPARLLDSPGPLESDCHIAAGARLRLSWFDPPPLQVGDRWQVTARLRPAWGYQNPGGFDYERWLFANNYQGTGYVRDRDALRLTAVQPATETFANWLAQSETRHQALVLALAKGDNSQISATHWRWFRDSGTIHLMVVSGLHVGIVVGVCYFLASLLLRLTLSGSTLNLGLLAALLALLAAAAFVVTAGFGIPAQRAWLMAAVLVCAIALGWRNSRLVSYVFSMSVVLLLDPLAVHSMGFYLSFGAVAVLLKFFSARLGSPNKLWQLVVVQLVLYLFMTPLLALGQSTLPLSGSLINLLAVPLLTLILPLLLLAASFWWLLPAVATGLLQLADLLLDGLLLGIELAAAGGGLQNGGGQPGRVLLALVAAVFLCSQLPWRFRLMLLLSWFAWITPMAAGVPPGEFRVIALDVGQGSALIVDTAAHRLLFDAGPAYPGGFNLGEAVVLPSLLKSGPGRLDVLVLSHQDLDHTGGAQVLRDHLEIEQIYSSFPLLDSPQLRVQQAQCAEGTEWHWNGVTFRFLTPAVTGSRSDNDRSCVLRVASATQTLILSGDISSRMEHRLVREMGGELAATVITAPHHGSNGSSSRRWIAAVTPRQVLISAPRRSRYGHPHADVVARYQSAGAQVAVTGLAGALVWESWQPGQVRGWREQHPAYWLNQVGRSGDRVHPVD